VHLIIKITSNALVRLVAAKENCFHESLKTIKTVRISKFVRQRVPDCRAGIVERPTAVRAESTARHGETVPDKWIIIGSDRRPETKQGIEGKIVRSYREGLGIGLGLGIIDRRSEAINFGTCYVHIADLNLSP